MMEIQQFNETVLARETLKRLGDPKNILSRAAAVLDIVAHGSVGLGEVLQDYATQGCSQLRDVIRAATVAGSSAVGTTDDKETLGNIHFILKTVKSVLDLIPAAMQRNKSDTLGEKDKLSRADIIELAHAFAQAPDIAPLLAAEDSGNLFASLVIAPHETSAVSAGVHDLMAASH